MKCGELKGCSTYVRATFLGGFSKFITICVLKPLLILHYIILFLQKNVVYHRIKCKNAFLEITLIFFKIQNLGYNFLSMLRSIFEFFRIISFFSVRMNIDKNINVGALRIPKLMHLFKYTKLQLKNLLF